MRRNFNSIVKLGFTCIFTFLLCGCDKEEDKYYKVSVNKAEIELTKETGSQTIQIASEKEWHLEGDGLKAGYGITIGQAEWYEVDKMYGNGNSTVTISLRDTKKTGNASTTLNVVGKHNRVTVQLKRVSTDK